MTLPIQRQDANTRKRRFKVDLPRSRKDGIVIMKRTGRDRVCPRKLTMGFTVTLNTRCAEHMPTRKWVFGQFPQTAKAGRMADELLSTAYMMVEVIHVDVMKFSSDH